VKLLLILNILERGLDMFQDILALLVRIDAALTVIAGKLDPNAIPGNQATQIRDALTALAQRAENLASGGVNILLSLPPSIPGGNTTTGSVGLSAPQPSDTIVNLSSSDPVLVLPTSVVIPAGITSIAFSVTTTNPATDTQVTATATVGTNSKTATVTVMHQ
jgi:hypothetical protein